MHKSAGIGFPARAAAIAALLAAALAGCTAYELATSDRLHAEDEQACTSAGRKPGTNGFAKCMQERELRRNPIR